MKGTVLRWSFALVLVLVWSGMAYAAGPQAKTPENYIVFKPGVFYPQGDIKDLSAGFNGEIAYGRRFHENAAFEIASGYIGTGNATLQRGTVRSTSGTTYSFKTDGDVYAIPITIAIKGIIPFEKNFEAYGIAGGGAYYVNARESAQVYGLTRLSLSDTAWVMGGFLGAGVSYNITREWFLGLEGRYLWVDKAKLRDSSQGVTVTGDVRMEGVQGVATIGYRF